MRRLAAVNGRNSSEGRRVRDLCKQGRRQRGAGSGEGENGRRLRVTSTNLVAAEEKIKEKAAKKVPTTFGLGTVSRSKLRRNDGEFGLYSGD